MVGIAIDMWVDIGGNVLVIASTVCSAPTLLTNIAIEHCEAVSTYLVKLFQSVSHSQKSSLGKSSPVSTFLVHPQSPLKRPHTALPHMAA